MSELVVSSSSMLDLPMALSSFGAATVDDFVYVYGGHVGQAHSYSRETTSSKFRRINLIQPAAWEELAGGPRLQGLPLVAHHGHLYRIGGMQPQNARSEKADTRSQATCARFDRARGMWAEIEALPEPRSSHDAVVVGDWLYVFGGWRLNGLAGKADWPDYGYRLDLAVPAHGWQRVEQPFRRRALTMAVHDGKVFVIGGIGESGRIERTVDVYEPQLGRWTQGPDLPVAGAHGFTPASATVGERLYVLPADGQILRLSWNSWETLGVMQQPRFAARMVAGSIDQLIILGGATATGLLSSVELFTIPQT